MIENRQRQAIFAVIEFIAQNNGRPLDGLKWRPFHAAGHIKDQTQGIPFGKFRRFPPCKMKK